MRLFVLSYIIATKNKKAFLEMSINELLKNKKADEEIIVVDGGSNDGTVELLESLLKSKKIDMYISGPDFGEAHALNKGILKSRGKLIKFITDDDVFDFNSIKRCKEFMLRNDDVDVLGSSGAGTDWSSVNPFIDVGEDDVKKYNNWRFSRVPFDFCGLGIMMRRDALPLLGLFNTSVIRVDSDFSYRITTGKANFCWYTGYTYIRISNSKSNSVVYVSQVNDEGNRLFNFYVGEKKDMLKSRFIFEKFTRALLACTSIFKESNVKSVLKKRWFDCDDTSWEICKEWLKIKNEKQKGVFLKSR